MITGCTAPVGSPAESDKAFEHVGTLRSCELVMRRTRGWPTGSCEDGCSFEMTVAVDRAVKHRELDVGDVSVDLLSGNYDEPQSIASTTANVEVIERTVLPIGYAYDRVTLRLVVSVDSLPAPLLQYQVNLLSLGFGVGGTGDHPYESFDRCETPESYVASMTLASGLREGGTVVDGRDSVLYTQADRDAAAQLILALREEPNESPPHVVLGFRDRLSLQPHAEILPTRRQSLEQTHYYAFDFTQLDPYAGLTCLQPWTEVPERTVFGFHVTVEGRFTEELRAPYGGDHIITFIAPPPCPAEEDLSGA